MLLDRRFVSSKANHFILYIHKRGSNILTLDPDLKLYDINFYMYTYVHIYMHDLHLIITQTCLTEFVNLFIVHNDSS